MNNTKYNKLNLLLEEIIDQSEPEKIPEIDEGFLFGPRTSSDQRATMKIFKQKATSDIYTTVNNMITSKAIAKSGISNYLENTFLPKYITTWTRIPSAEKAKLLDLAAEAQKNWGGTGFKLSGTLDRMTGIIYNLVKFGHQEPGTEPEGSGAGGSGAGGSGTAGSGTPSLARQMQQLITGNWATLSPGQKRYIKNLVTNLPD